VRALSPSLFPSPLVPIPFLPSVPSRADVDVCGAATDEQGNSRGFAHAIFETVEEAQEAKKAIEESGVLLGGRAPRVDFAAERQPRQPVQRGSRFGLRGKR
jgi:hypothetical protein